MTTQLHLTDDELLSLTHLRRPSAQARALRAMGVPYRPGPTAPCWWAAWPPSAPWPARRRSIRSARQRPMGCGGARRREDF